MLFLLSALVSASGLGVSPDRLFLYSGEKASVWVSNPNPFAVAVMVDSDCPSLNLSGNSLVLAPNSNKQFLVNALAGHCTGQLSLTVNHSDNQGIGFFPGVSIPIELVSPVHTVHQASFAPSKLVGCVTTIFIVALGTLVYYGFRSIGS
ncbi:MAG: hypothetical protein V1837_01175 [Candidatus Woesearchaeota archaeon]